MVDIGQKEEFRADPISADSNFRQYDAADRWMGRGVVALYASRLRILYDSEHTIYRVHDSINILCILPLR